MGKTYNPFKMWGSWFGLGVGIVGTLLYTWILPIAPFRDLFSFTILTNPLIWLVGWPTLPIIMTTPVVMFLYGWGIHSIFRKLERGARIKLTIAIVVIVSVGFTFSYIQGKQAFKAANPYYDYSVSALLSSARDESLDINTRLTMLEVMAVKVEGMNVTERQSLSSQLASFDTSGLSDIDKERVAGRITMLQNLLTTK